MCQFECRLCHGVVYWGYLCTKGRETPLEQRLDRAPETALY